MLHGSDSFGQVLRRVAGICHLVNQVQLFDCKEIRHARAAVEFSEFTSAQFGVMEAGVLRLHKLAETVEVMARFACDGFSFLSTSPLVFRLPCNS